MPSYPESLDPAFIEWSFSKSSYGVISDSTHSSRTSIPPSTRSFRDNGVQKSPSSPTGFQQNTTNPLLSRLDQTFPHCIATPLISTLRRPSRVHIPRPPNAFMLFRSDLLKRGVIPSHIERRQQNLSRIAGQCWNLLSTEEKAKWQDKAMKALVDHQKRNPHYKFTPSPRGSRTKAKVHTKAKTDEAEGEDRIRQIREEYTHITGPSATPTRRSRVRRHRRWDQKTADECSPSQTYVSPPASPPPSFLLPGNESEEPPLPPFFPQCSFPHVVIPRRPSTSLGFSVPYSFQDSPSARTGLALIRPSSAALSDTNLVIFSRDCNITPVSSDFGSITTPGASSSPPMDNLHTTSVVTLPDVPDAPHKAAPFDPLNLPFAAVSQPLENEPKPPQDSDVDCFPNSLYANDSFAFMKTFPNLEEYSPFGDDHLFDILGSQGLMDLGNCLTDTAL